MTGMNGMHILGKQITMTKNSNIINWTYEHRENDSLSQR